MTGEAADDMSRPGQDASEAVAHWIKKIKVDASCDAIRSELKETGAWDDDELEDDDANLERLLWISANNIKEENN